MTRTRRALALTLVLLTTAAGVSACSEADTPVAPQATPQYTGGAASGEHSQADVDFASKLFPYYIQANKLSGIGTARAENPQVRDLATSLGAAQGEPVAKFAGWLSGWKQAVPADAPGPLNDADVSKLTQLDGHNFDTAWLALVIRHQQSSIKALQGYLKNGKNAEIEQYTQKLVDEQKADLKSAKELLATYRG
jgi:uncharacterized protein (DUF305 family)